MQSRNVLVIAIAALLVVILLAYAYRGSQVTPVPADRPTQSEPQQPAPTKPGQ